MGGRGLWAEDIGSPLCCSAVNQYGGIMCVHLDLGTVSGSPVFLEEGERIA